MLLNVIKNEIESMLEGGDIHIRVCEKLKDIHVFLLKIKDLG